MSGDFSEDEKRALLADVREIKETLNGKGDSPGMKVELDRLKQAEAERKWVVRGIVSMVGISMLDLVKRAIWGH